jgi:hypothetical protein
MELNHCLGQLGVVQRIGVDIQETVNRCDQVDRGLARIPLRH